MFWLHLVKARRETRLQVQTAGLQRNSRPVRLVQGRNSCHEDSLQLDLMAAVNKNHISLLERDMAQDAVPPETGKGPPLGLAAPSSALSVAACLA